MPIRGRFALFRVVLALLGLSVALTPAVEEFRVFHVEVSLAGDGDDAARGADYYLAGGSDDGLRVGQRLEVYRDRTVFDPVTNEGHASRLPVGELVLIAVDPTSSIGRRVSLVSRDRAPLLRHHAVMIGDVATPVAESVDEAIAEPGEPPAGTPVTAGVAVELPSSVLFDLDSAVLKSADTEFSGVEDALRRFPRHHLIVEGHTCDLGSRTHNEKLALARARAVAAYLAQRFEIPERRMTVVGYGPDRPIDPRKDGRPRNRRVEIRFVTRPG